MHVHKMRLDPDGKQIGKAEYHTPQSQQMVDTGSDQMISVNIQEAMQVSSAYGLSYAQLANGGFSRLVMQNELRRSKSEVVANSGTRG